MHDNKHNKNNNNKDNNNYIKIISINGIGENTIFSCSGKNVFIQNGKNVWIKILNGVFCTMACVSIWANTELFVLFGKNKKATSKDT